MRQLLGTITRGELPLWVLFGAFLLTIVVGPITVFGAVLVALISIEATALPWLSLLLGPIAVLAIVGPIAATFGVGIFRAADRFGPPGVFVKIALVGAVLFAPMIGWVFAMQVLSRN